MDMSTMMVHDGARSPQAKGSARVYDFRFRVKFMASTCMALDMEFLQRSFLHRPRGHADAISQAAFHNKPCPAMNYPILRVLWTCSCQLS